MAATLRLPADLEEKLGAYCELVGATKSRVTVLALRTYLEGGAPALPVAREYDSEPATEAAQR
jgi:hypothetical protein